MNYVHFCDEDRNWANCEVVWNIEQAKKIGKTFEPFFSIGTRGWDNSKRDEVLGFLRSKGITADMDEYSGEIHILVERKQAKQDDHNLALKEVREFLIRIAKKADMNPVMPEAEMSERDIVQSILYQFDKHFGVEKK